MKIKCYIFSAVGFALICVVGFIYTERAGLNMTFMERIRELIGLRSDAHRQAHDYWKDCSCTFLAGDPTYYDRQEAAMREMLDGIDIASERALDIGCGNGRFSFVIGEYAKEVLAFDLSSKLIEEANIKAAEAGVLNVKFLKQDLEDGFPKDVYGVVSCMGVTSTIIDDSVFRDLINNISRSTATGGYLFTKDSLGAYADKKITSGSYITIYRAQSRYEAQIAQAGFELVKKVQLADTGELVNFLYLWKKA